MSRRRKAERRSQASADEAVRRASVEQDGDTPGTLRGGKEARQVWFESRIWAGPHRKRGEASQRSQLGLHHPGQLIDGVVNQVGADLAASPAERSSPSARASHEPAHEPTRPPERGGGGLPADESQGAQRAEVPLNVERQWKEGQRWKLVSQMPAEGENPPTRGRQELSKSLRMHLV